MGREKIATGSITEILLLTMKLLRFLLQALADLLKGITYKWILALIGILKAILKALKDFWKRRKLPHADKNATNDGCGPIHHTSFHRPDPLIYCQRYLLKLGLAVTWDNPDIVLMKDGVIVPEGELLPNTEYEIDARIWNNSFDAPVVGLVVDFSYLSFGAGTTLNFIGTTAINLGVKGGINHPAHARMLWTTPPAGHYCIQVNLKWADDLNPENNLGQNNVNVVSPQSPAMFSFQLRNDTPKSELFRLQTDTYTLPQLRDCDDESTKPPNNDAKWRSIQSIHNSSNYPIPPGWAVALTPEEITLAPDEEAEIHVTITPPDDFTGRQAFNIHAGYGSGKYAGGVTVYVTKS